MASLDIDINEILRDCDVGTLRLTGMRRFNLRLSITLLLIRLAAWVAPCRIDVEDDAD